MTSLLTSGGLTNNKLVEVFKGQLDKPVEQTKVAFLITASLGEAGDKAWLAKDLNNLYMTGVAEVDIVDIAGSPKAEWLPRLREADVIWVEGGNTKFLMYHIEKSGLKGELPELLKSRLYVGVSAGSMVMGECLPENVETSIYPADKFIEPYKHVHKYLGWMPIHILPHFRDDSFKTSDDEVEDIAKHVHAPIYALDNNSAIIVENGDVKKVISDGAWTIFLPKE